jgi:hypothetical protein
VKRTCLVSVVSCQPYRHCPYLTREIHCEATRTTACQRYYSRSKSREGASTLWLPGAMSASISLERTAKLVNPNFITPTASPTTVSSTRTGASSNPSVTFLSINPSATYLGPLTTDFTPPKSCFDNITQWRITENVIFHRISGHPNCYPGDVRVLSQTFDGYYYSPGVCPSGFTEACQDRVQWPAAAVAITASLYCPR